MKKKKSEKRNKFTPLEHQDLEFKHNLINLAKSLRAKEGFENQLASAFIYVSFAEYIADHLLETLRYFIYDNSYKNFGGIIFVDQRDLGQNRTLGMTIKELEGYNFSDKDGILELLDGICQMRNDLFHSLARVNLSTAQKYTEEMLKIQDLSEKLIDKIDVVYAGLKKILIPQEVGSNLPQNQENNV